MKDNGWGAGIAAENSAMQAKLNQQKTPYPFGVAAEPANKFFEPVPEGLTLDQMKEYHQQKDKFDVYLIERNIRQLIIMAKMLAYELDLRGHPLLDKDVTDLQELSRKI